MTWNREQIEIIPYPGLHSESDILIHFPKAGVLCMGDMLLSQSCPAVNDAAGYLKLFDKVLNVFPARTTFVSGHGRDLRWAELKTYRADMAAMADLVRKAHAGGRTADDMVRADLLKAYKADYSRLDWLGPDSWIRTVVRGLQAGK
jgi:glyoxylase-like metal-dependent hydrolase (beta-lactamase superfamily II)